MLVFAGIMRPKAAAPYAQAFAGSSEMKHDTKLMMYRAEVADKITERTALPGLTHSHVGFHGTSPVVKALPYIDPLVFFLIPFAHSLLYGLIKNFWGRLLPSKTGVYTCAVSL